MKLSSVIVLFGMMLAFSGVVEGQSCIEKIDTAQSCVKQCLDAESLKISPVTSTMYGNKLFECLESTSGVTEELQSCCGMNSIAGCETSLVEAKKCLVTTELLPLKEAGKDYLHCIADNYYSRVCSFGNFCIAILTGGYGTGAPNDFSVGALQGATTCTDPDLMTFGKDVCTQVTPCCSECAKYIPPIVNAVIDKLILPTVDCSANATNITTCEDYTGTAATNSTRRDLEMVGSDTIHVQNADLATQLASECVDVLANDLILYNETFAVNNHFDCLSKKMGKISAEMDGKTNESSSPRSRSSVSAMIMMAMSMIVSAAHFVVE